METFIWNGKRGQALKKRHDDLLSALAIALQLYEPHSGALMVNGTLDQETAMKIIQGMSRGASKLVAGRPVPPGVSRHAVQASQHILFEFGWVLKN
jgi:hypothetical protein